MGKIPVLSVESGGPYRVYGKRWFMGQRNKCHGVESRVLVSPYLPGGFTSSNHLTRPCTKKKYTKKPLKSAPRNFPEVARGEKTHAPKPHHLHGLSIYLSEQNCCVVVKPHYPNLTREGVCNESSNFPQQTPPREVVWKTKECSQAAAPPSFAHTPKFFCSPPPTERGAGGPFFCRFHVTNSLHHPFTFSDQRHHKAELTFSNHQLLSHGKVRRFQHELRGSHLINTTISLFPPLEVPQRLARTT